MRSQSLIVDADVICYSIAFRNEDEVDWDDDGEVERFVNKDKALLEVEQSFREFREKIPGADRIIIVLSDNDQNFRVQLDETYKANRKDKRKPELWQTIRNLLEAGVDGYRVIQKPRLEGDDVMGILATCPKYRDRCTMLTIDKDMLTVPGKVYFWNHSDKGVIPITDEEAQWNHLWQALVGDPVDNYIGCRGIGEKRGKRIMDGCESPKEFWEAIVDTFESKGYEYDDALHQARLAFILHYGYYKKGKVKLWKPNNLIG